MTHDQSRSPSASTLWCHRLAGAGLLVLALLTVPALPATAGGPTSVLLANPATGQVAALGYDDDDYDRLADLVGARGELSGPVTTPTGSTSDQSTDFTEQIRLTWMIHDTSVWRLDIIHGREDGAWVIETRQSSDGGDVWQTNPIWHRPTDPARLYALFRGVGLMTPETEGSDGYGLASPKAAAFPPAADGDPTAVVVSTGLICLASGSALGIVGSRVWRARTRRR